MAYIYEKERERESERERGREREEREKERGVKAKRANESEYILLRTGCFSQPHFKILVRGMKNQELDKQYQPVEEKEREGKGKTSIQAQKRVE